MRSATARTIALLLGMATAAPLTRAQQASPESTTPLTVTGVPGTAPLTIAAHATSDLLTIHVALQAGWHLYGKDTGAGQPVQVEVLDGSSFAAAGALATPMDDSGQITGNADLTLPLRRVADGDALHATMRFMVCDALECLPPMAVTLANAPESVAATPLRVLLVAVDRSERTDRIAGFLRDRGFDTTVTTYADVKAADCDSVDVVVADSPYFGQFKGAIAPARKFPETQSPIVAVGFLGTELLEAQRVSMACGYI